MQQTNAANPTEVCFLVSDGSVSRSGLAGCACRVLPANSDVPLKFMAVLGSVTTTQAELLGGILGLVALRVLSKQERLVATWSCDCKTVIDSASRLPSGQEISTLPSFDPSCFDLTSPDSFGPEAINRLGMPSLRDTWKLYHLAINRIEVIPVWSGDPQVQIDVEAVDKASRWASTEGERLLKRWGEGAVGRLKYLDPKAAWKLLDLRILGSELDPVKAYRQILSSLDRVL